MSLNSVEMGKVVLISGGIRSGKSSFALKKAKELPGKKVFLAVAQPIDKEMIERIKRHQQERGSQWVTIEEPLEIAKKLKELIKDHQVILVECLTTWVGNMLYHIQNKDLIEERFKQLTKLLKQNLKKKMANIFIVTNETGLGIVPDNLLAREYLELLGKLNQMIVEISDEVYFMIAGLPLKLK